MQLRDPGFPMGGQVCFCFLTNDPALHQLCALKLLYLLHQSWFPDALLGALTQDPWQRAATPAQVADGVVQGTCEPHTAPAAPGKPCVLSLCSVTGR